MKKIAISLLLIGLAACGDPETGVLPQEPVEIEECDDAVNAEPCL